MSTDQVSLHVSSGATPADIIRGAPCTPIVALSRERAAEIDIPELPPALTRTKRYKPSTEVTPIEEEPKVENKEATATEEEEGLVADYKQQLVEQRESTLHAAREAMTLKDARDILQFEETYECVCQVCEEDFDGIEPSFTICPVCEDELH